MNTPSSNVDYEYDDMKLMRLRNSLPFGYAEILRDRIAEKTGRFYALNSIRRHLTVKYSNSSTIAEAFLLAEETKLKRQQNARRVAHFR
jgi:hypothetical protein